MTGYEAQRVIGQSTNHDYILSPSEHVERYRDVAPALAGLLRSARLKAEANAYHMRDSEALSARHAYRAWMTRTNVAILVVSVLGALSMSSEVLSIRFANLPDYLSRVLSAFTALATGLGAFGLFKLREGKLLETWMTKRAAAETHRIGYFSALGNAARCSSDTDLLSLILEYFRRYHFDLQQAFFTERARQHSESANWTVSIGAAGAGIAALASLLSAGGEGVWSAFGALTVTGAALGAFSVGREQMTQDRRNAERYSRTADALVAISYRLDVVRKAASVGNGTAVAEFIDAVNEQVSNEHRQWLEGAESAKSAIARLEMALGDLNTSARTGD